MPELPCRKPASDSADALALWKLAFAGLLVLAFMAAMYVARAVILPIMLAFLLSFLLSPLVRGLNAIRIPMYLAAGLVMVGVLLAVVAGVWLLFDPALQWLERLPELLEPFRRRTQELTALFRRAAEATGEASGTVRVPPQIAQTGLDLGGVIIGSTWRLLGGVLVMLFLLYFLLATGDLLLRKLVKVLPSMRHKRMAVVIAHSIRHEVSQYLFTITLINATLGIVVGAAMYLLGMPNPVLWGVMAGVLNFIPYLGPALTLSVLSAVAVFTFDSFGEALLRPLAFLVLTTLEGQLITPLILGRRLMLNPVIIFISLIFWAWLWGFPGALVAVPITMIIKILCDSIPPLSPIGELLSR